MKKVFPIIFTLLTLACVLTGCVQSTLGVKLNKDGTGSISARLGIREDFYEQLKDNGGDPFEGKETVRYEEDGETYISYTEAKNYSSYEDMEKALSELTYDTEMYENVENNKQTTENENITMTPTADKHIFKEVSINKNSGIFYSAYSFNATLNPQDKDQNGQNANDLYKFVLTVEMPDKITQSQNGKVTENKIEFEIKDITEATEFAAVSEVNHYGVIIGIIAILAAGATAFVIIVKKKH